MVAVVCFNKNLLQINSKILNNYPPHGVINTHKWDNLITAGNDAGL